MAHSSQLMWYIAAIGATGAAALCIVFIVARVLKHRVGGDESSEPFTLQDLREMRARGDITETEYETMRTAMFGLSAGVSEREAGGGSCETESLDV